MKSFLLNNLNKPTILWGNLPDNIHFLGDIPEGYSLALSPGDSNIVILDVDCKNGKNGYDYIPQDIYLELGQTFYYDTKSGGRHYFIKYLGSKILKNTSTKFGLDLRIGSKTDNAGGYVRYQGNLPINQIDPLIKESSPELNSFLEKLFC